LAVKNCVKGSSLSDLDSQLCGLQIKIAFNSLLSQKKSHKVLSVNSMSGQNKDKRAYEAIFDMTHPSD